MRAPTIGAQQPQAPNAFDTLLQQSQQMQRQQGLLPPSSPASNAVPIPNAPAQPQAVTNQPLPNAPAQPQQATPSMAGAQGVQSPDGVLPHPSAQPAAPRPAPAPHDTGVRRDLTENQYGNADLARRLVAQGIPADAVEAMCGPIAAAGALKELGVAVDPATLARWGVDNGQWSGSAGMLQGGGAGMQAMLAAQGVQSQVLGPDQQAAAVAAVQAGRPVIINTAGHYLLASDYDPATQKFYVGSTGSNALRNGSDWMTLPEILAHPGTRGELRAFIVPTSAAGASPQQGANAAATDPNPYGQMAIDAANKYGVPPQLLRAQLQWESGGFDPDVISGKRTSSAGAVGLGQFMPATAQAYGVDPTDPRSSADGAARYMADLYKQYGDWDTALIAYNGGDAAVRAYRSGQPFAETTSYLKNVHALMTGGGAQDPGGAPPPNTPANGSPFAPAEQPFVANPDQSQPNVANSDQSPEDWQAPIRASLDRAERGLADLGQPQSPFAPSYPSEQWAWEQQQAQGDTGTDPLAQAAGAITGAVGSGVNTVTGAIGSGAQSVFGAANRGSELLTPGETATVGDVTGRLGQLGSQSLAGADDALRQAYRDSPVQTAVGIANWVRTGDTSGLDDPLGRYFALVPGAGAFNAESAAFDPIRQASVGGALNRVEGGAAGVDAARARYQALPGWLQTVIGMVADPANLIPAGETGRAAGRGIEGAAQDVGQLGSGMLGVTSDPVRGALEEAALARVRAGQPALAGAAEQAAPEAQQAASRVPSAAVDLGWNPPARLQRALLDRGVTAPWQLTRDEFANMKAQLTLGEGRSEIDRVARALSVRESLPDAMRQYGQDFSYENPTLVRRYQSVQPDSTVTIYRAAGKNDPNGIRPGDWVAIDRAYAVDHGAAGYGDAGGSKIVSLKVKAKDVSWAGTSADEWIYTPEAARSLPGDMTPHKYLVQQALARGEDVPARVLADYPDLAAKTGSAPPAGAQPGSANLWFAAHSGFGTAAGGGMGGLVGYTTAPPGSTEEQKLERAKQGALIGAGAGFALGAGAGAWAARGSAPTAYGKAAAGSALADVQAIRSAEDVKAATGGPSVGGALMTVNEKLFNRFARLWGLGQNVRDAIQSLGGSGARAKAILETELRPILQSVPDVHALNDYLIANQVQDLAAAGMKTPRGLTAQQATDALKQMKATLGDQGYKAIEDAAQRLYEFQDRNLLQRAVDSGLVSQEAAAAMRAANPHYFPHQVFDREVARGSQAGGYRDSMSVASSTIKRRIGSELDIRQPLDAIVNRVYALNRVADRNDAANVVIPALERAGIATKWTSDALPPVGMEKIDRLINGVHEQWIVPHEIAGAVKQMDAPTMGLVEQIFGRLNGISRAGYTVLSPAFLARNVSRDIADRFVRSGRLPGPDYARGIFAALTHNGDWEAFQRAYGGYGGILDHLGARATVQDLARSDRARFVRTVTNPFELMRTVNEIAEQGPKIGDFIHYQKQGMSPIRAAMKAREGTADYWMGGTLAKGLNPVVMFLNANLRFLYNAAEPLVAGTPKQRFLAAARIGSLAAATAGVYAWNNSFKYQQGPKQGQPMLPDIPQYDQNIGWAILTGETTDEKGNQVPTYIRVPKPTALVPVGMLVDEIAKWQQGRAGQGVLPAIGGAVTGMSPFNPSDVAGSILPPVIQAPTEVQSNYSLFRQAPIEPDKVHQLPAQFRELPGTTETAKAIANTQAPGGASLSRAIGLSAPQVDYLGHNILGGIYDTAAYAADAGLRAAGLAPPKGPTTTAVALARNPLTRGVIGARGGQQDQDLMGAYESRRNQAVDAAVQALQQTPLYQQADKATRDQLMTDVQTRVDQQLRQQAPQGTIPSFLEPKPPDHPPKYDPAIGWVQRLMRETNSADPYALERVINEAVSTPVRSRTLEQRKLAYYAQYASPAWRKWQATTGKAQKDAAAQQRATLQGITQAATATP